MLHFLVEVMAMSFPVLMPDVGTIGHIDPPSHGDCLSGLKRSHAQGYTAQDVNTHVTGDGHVVGAHYAQIGDNHFHDPLGKIAKNREIGSLTLKQCQRLRPNDGGPQRIDAVTNWMGWCAAHGFALCLEAKPDQGAESVEPWARVAEAAAQTGAVVVVMAIQSWAPRSVRGRSVRLADWEARSKRRLKAARAAELPTVLLYRSHVHSDWWPILSAVKGGPRTPQGVAHLGNGLSRVTRHGGSVTPRQVHHANAKIHRLGGTFPNGGRPMAHSTTGPPLTWRERRRRRRLRRRARRQARRQLRRHRKARR